MSDTTRTVDLPVKPEVTPFFDTLTNTVSYLVKDPGSNACAVIDSVMDIDYAAGRIAYKSADNIVAFITQHSLKLEWLIETTFMPIICPLRPTSRQARRQDRHR